MRIRQEGNEITRMQMLPARKLKHKFGAIRCKRDAIKFPSKLERRYYDKLKMLQNSGKVLLFLRQPGFDLPGGVRYFADFQVFWADGTVDFVDTKGRDTAIGIAKRKMTEDLYYPIKIKIVKKV